MHFSISSCPFYIVTYCIKLATTSWTYSNLYNTNRYCPGVRDALGRGLPEPGLRLAGREAHRLGQLLHQQGHITFKQKHLKRDENKGKGGKREGKINDIIWPFKRLVANLIFNV